MDKYIKNLEKEFSIIKNVCTRVILYNKRRYGYF